MKKSRKPAPPTPPPVQNALWLGGEKFEFVITPAILLSAEPLVREIQRQLSLHDNERYQVDDLDAAMQRRSIVILDEVNRLPWLNWAGVKTTRWARIKSWFRRKWNA